ncbi:FAD-dependent oxidoreductase [Chloroflexota bacterium]
MVRVTRLFEPIKIGTLQLDNRIVMSGFPLISTEDTSQSGVIHEKYVDFFEERAKGGAGLIILPDTCVDRNVRFQSHPCIGGIEFNPGLSSLTEAVHMWGTKIAPDLMLDGTMWELRDKDWHPMFPFSSDWRPYNTSPLSYDWRVAKQVDMPLDLIPEVEELFADAALRARVTGFDAIQLAGQFGMLISQFLSPYFNKRTDAYGGSLENRMRFAIEIIEKIRNRIGETLPIIFRLSADEFVEGGLRIGESKIIAKCLEDAGVNMLNICVGILRPSRHDRDLHIAVPQATSFPTQALSTDLSNQVEPVKGIDVIIPPMGSTQGTYVDLAAQIKRVVNIPVMYAGRITEPLFAEQLLEEGKIDLVGMARQLVADPYWPTKVSQSRYSDIVPCLGCGECFQRILIQKVSRCSVNAAVGREKEFKIVSSSKPLKIMVVGGGPAGMEMARVAALRNHTVSIYEKEDRLGGQLILAAKPPYKNEIRQLMEYLVLQVQRLGTEINLGSEVTIETIRYFAPDVVIIATGARPLVPEIAGVGNANVITAWEVLAGREVGKKVVIAGGGMVGCETAEFLVDRRAEVSIVEMLPEIASDVERHTNRPVLLERLSKYDINILTNSLAEAVTDRGLLINQSGQKKVVEADTIVLAMGVISNNALAIEARNRFPRVHMIGDCVRPGRISNAINQASYLARQIELEPDVMSR